MSSSENLGLTNIMTGRSKLINDNNNECKNKGDWLELNNTKVESKDSSKLHEMGEALDIAENRCKDLKEQLDQVKYAYKQRTSQPELLHDNVLESFKNATGVPKKQLQRQNSGAIGTDNSGAAVITINNILSGITNSINRLSLLHSTIDNEGKVPVKAIGKIISTPPERVKHPVISEELSRSSENLCPKSSVTSNPQKERKKRFKRRSAMSIEPSVKSSSQIKLQKSTSKKSRQKDRNETMSNISIKKRKRQNKFKLTTKTSVPKMSKHPRSSGLPFTSNNLVEIYHNPIADSESDDNEEEGVNTVHRVRSSYMEIKPKLKNRTEVPPIGVCGYPEYPTNSLKPSLSPIQENVPMQNENDHNFISHNYEMPTIASKMKQVARGYFRHFATKAIPFCAAKSTTPSHNIGINIQQVMNIIKNRQPIVGISPTLAHNIGLAAGKINHQSLSAIVSSLGSKMGYKYTPCPLIRDSLHTNYKQLQEVAKEVPEDFEEPFVSKNGIDNETPKNTWTVDPNNQTQCTCVQGIQQVATKPQFNPQQSQVTSYQKNNQYAKKIMKRTHQKYKHIKSTYAQYNNKFASKKCDGLSANKNDEEDNNDASMPLKGKEKILKGVLLNLHEEFGMLTNTYDELYENINQSSETNVSKRKELESLEKKLNDKEEEIQMVMALYTEVVNLKQQVRALREKASFASLIIEQQKHQMFNPHMPQYQVNGQPRYKEFKDPAAALHLTKLLRQIQAYQDVSKNGGK